MLVLRSEARNYLAMRRRLGFKLRFLDSLLNDFASFVAAKGSTFITTALALEWATRVPGAKAVTTARRLSIARRFAQHCSCIDDRNQVPPPWLLPWPLHRPNPYIYSGDEVRRLMAAASPLPSKSGLEPHTYRTLIGLLAVTGLRRGEVLGLERDDVDLTRGVLTIQGAKFGKSRLVPIHRSTRLALEAYCRQRDSIQPQPSGPSFFLSDSGTRLTARKVNKIFRDILRISGVGGRGNRPGPRLHDLRHAFVVRTLIGWYRAGADVNRLMPALTTYVGHARVVSTYWYISAVPELLRLAVRRLEQRRPCHEDPRRLPRIAGGFLFGSAHARPKGQPAYHSQL